MCNILEYKGESPLYFFDVDAVIVFATREDGLVIVSWRYCTDCQIPKSFTDAMPLYSSSAQSHQGIMN
jgi:hypothetical protein